MHRFALAAALSLFVGCGSDSGNKNTDGGNGQVDATGPAADAPPLVGDKYSLHWGPVPVAAGVEDVKCIWVRLGNDAEIKVHQLHNVLSSVSHHLIVYRDNKHTTEQTTPTTEDCTSFSGALNIAGTVFPMMITQKHDDELTLPDGVAYTLAAHQMIKIEMHFINSTDNDGTGEASIDFYAAAAASIHDEANILFIGSPDIDLMPGDQTTLHQFFKVPSGLDLSASKIFAITGHTHKLGQDVQVKVGASATGTLTTVYDPSTFLWSEPETTTHSPAFSVPQGGGFDFSCKYHNTTSQEVKFGESANDEMCFFWAYYYPSQGSFVCVHTNMIGSLDVCCPAPAGDATSMQVCNYISSHF